jgi:ferrous-iron efflux pump FieF
VAHLMRRAALASVALSALLILVKGVAFFLSGSIAILGALADSTMDLIASTANLLAVRHALMPADQQHRFGHGKAEPIAGLAQALFIVASTVFLVYEAVQRIRMPAPIAYEGLGIAVMVFSTVVTFALVVFQRRVVRQTRSTAIAADNVHYAGDLLTNLGVIVGLVLSAGFGWYLADPLIGLAIALVLIASAWHVLRGSYDQLMDREFSDRDRQRIKSVVLQHPEVKGVHDLRTRTAGTQRFIQLHVEMDPAISLGEAHETCDQIEGKLLQLYPGADILIHQDPYGLEKPPPPLAMS